MLELLKYLGTIPGPRLAAYFLFIVIGTGVAGAAIADIIRAFQKRD